MRLNPKDIVAAAGAACLTLAAPLAFGERVGAGAVQAAIGVALVLVALLAVYRRLAAEQERTRREVRRMEPLLAVHRVLPLRAPLPPMSAGGDGWAIPPDTAAFLISLLREVRPRTVLETGCGVSTLVMGYVLETLGEGTLIAIEHDPRWAEVARRRVREHGLEARVRIVEAPLVATEVGGVRAPFYAASAFEGLPPLDLVFADAPPAEGADRWARYPLMSRVAPILSARAVVVLHYVRDVEREIASRWVREHPGFSREDLPLEKGAIVLRRAPAG